jgi:hypothetical protein
VAIATVTPAVSPAQLTLITSEEISRYAEITSQLSQIEAQQKSLRAELLDLHTAGAEQETGSPYLLAFVDQVRRTVDWKNHALQLATKLYGIEKAEQWKLKVEVAAPAQAITQIRVKPNPQYAANVASPPARRPVASIVMLSESLARSGTRTSHGAGPPSRFPALCSPAAGSRAAFTRKDGSRESDSSHSL